jgi:hypothetical protein
MANAIGMWKPRNPTAHPLQCLIYSFFPNLYILLLVLGFESGPYAYQGGILTPEPLHQFSFVLGIFKIGFRELFARAGFELQFS